jgi:hypothetical protein
MEVGMRKLIGVLTGFVAIIALCTFIVAQEGGVDVPQKPESGGGGLPDEAQKALEDAIKAATDKLADLGQKKLSESDLDSVLKETLSAIDALKKLLNQTKDAAMKDIINQLIKELNNVKEIVELTKREYSWNDVYGCPYYNKQRAADALRKIDEILKKLAGGK